MVPFAPSLTWYSAWWKARREGLSDSEAISKANLSTGTGGKDFARTLISANGNDILLSMAIEGGAATLKKSSRIPEAKLSDHGNWRHVHLGALEAAYGRSPYYQHLIPYIREVYESQENTLCGFNTAIHQAVCSFLNIAGSIKADRIFSIKKTSAAEKRGDELAAVIDPRYSIIDALMRLGPESILAVDIL